VVHDLFLELSDYKKEKGSRSTQTVRGEKKKRVSSPERYNVKNREKVNGIAIVQKSTMIPARAYEIGEGGPFVIQVQGKKMACERQEPLRACINWEWVG